MTDIVERLRELYKFAAQQKSRDWDEQDEIRDLFKHTFNVAYEAADEIDQLREALTIALSALVAATSLLKRSEDEKVKPSRAVASNKIFRLMMVDYERAEDNARAALLGEKE